MNVTRKYPCFRVRSLLMRWLLMLLLVACVPARVAPGTIATTPPRPTTPAIVSRVVDGDTLDVEIDGQVERIRLIGIDTPEIGDCYGVQAAAHVIELLPAGIPITLERDTSQRDRYGRLLRYVYLEGEMINEQLVTSGFARAATYPPDVRYQPRFVAGQQEARSNKAGLWSRC